MCYAISPHLFHLLHFFYSFPLVYHSEVGGLKCYVTERYLLMENANGSYKQTKKDLLKNFNTWRLIHNIRFQCPSCEQLYLGIFALIFF